MLKTVLVLILILAGLSSLHSQTLEKEYMVDLVEKLKQDARGPYRDIKWFCTDGSLRDPKDPCPMNIGPGIQHARYKQSIEALGKNHHLYLGQILSYTDKVNFWDDKFNHDRLKQYQIEKFLKLNDDGWILQKAQYYRGAFQVEDEQAWGRTFFKWLMTQDQAIVENYYLIRSALRDIPHDSNDNVAQLMRSLSKTISDEFPAFMNLRIKIHGQPEVSDIEKVITFKEKNKSTLSANQNAKIDELVSTMKTFYNPKHFETLKIKSKLFNDTLFGRSFSNYLRTCNNETNPETTVIESAKLILELRKFLLIEKKADKRLEMFEISLILEDIIFNSSAKWQPDNISKLVKKIHHLSMASTGAGYIELWEWEQIRNSLLFTGASTTLGELMNILDVGRRTVEWSTSTVKANYQDVVNVFAVFEHKSHGFIDDKIRSSLTLYLGNSVSDLGNFLAKESGLSNKVLTLSDQSSFRGLNPGYALGELVVVAGSAEDTEVQSDKIYIFERPPSDLKPIAGIATVSEGNLVSHVQLLARNLGIPNAALSDKNLKALLAYNGKRVFYAVSNKGNVLLKLESDMTAEERKLFEKKVRTDEKIAVPIEKIILTNNSILNLRSVRSFDSGKLCGPKAANLGELKHLFPDNVVEGLVIPFGVFKDHMNQKMLGTSGSYWDFLQNMFATAEIMSLEKSEPEIEAYQLGQLEILRKAIKIMPLKPEFQADLENQFKSIFGKSLGSVPVFLRSDTNMEDLKDFTGAGLNLTLFNVLAKDYILNGIRDVWASPYTERSFKWRQKYLLNPENVFPSILVIPSVDVDYSGVLITKGISLGGKEDLTVAFSRGAGGAVDGQSAETYMIRKIRGRVLLAPSREPYYNTLPSTGGTGKKLASFEKPILNDKNILDIRNLAKSIRELMQSEDPSINHAFDVELGFKDDKLWLFQIRPFVENKKALGSGYLESITTKIDKKKQILLTQQL